jgi:hypothetical protein
MRNGGAGAITIAVVVFDTLTLGFVTLGFEMVAGRVLTPLFGSGIYTWAMIISMVVAGLMCGYFAGGLAADRYPSFGLVAVIKLLSGAYLLLVYFLSFSDFEPAFTLSDNDIAALFLAALIVCFPPLLVLGMFSPLAVRLLLDDPHSAGRVAGGLFALSSLGNIVGILVTTFLLIPNFGTRAIILSFATFVLLSSLASIAVARSHARARVAARPER